MAAGVGGDLQFYPAPTAKMPFNRFSLPLAATLALVVFAANLSVPGPMIQADEGSYLANAAAIAGFPNDLASSYHAGYSIFIAPAFMLADTPQGVWFTVKAINALFFFITVLSLWSISCILNSGAGQPQRLVAVGLVSLYPMWAVMAGYSFAQIAFVPVFLLMFISYVRSVEGGAVSWLGLGLLSGLLYWIHPTAVAALIAVSLGAGYVAWRRRCYRLFLVLLITIGAMVVLYRYGVRPWLYERMTISGLEPRLHYPNPLSMFSPFLSLDGIKEIVARTGGHLFYLTIGTVGLIWVGLFALTERALRKTSAHVRSSGVRDRAVATFMWLSLLGMIGLSVLLFSSTPEARRLDHWMYGRYVEGVIAPILLAGTLAASHRKALWAVPIAVLCAILLSLGLDTYTHVAFFNASALWELFWLQEQGLWVWLAVGCTLIIIAAAAPRQVGLLVIALVFSYAGYLQIKWHVAAAEGATNRWGAAITVREQFPPGTCVGFDHSGIDSYDEHVYWFDFGFILFDYEMKRMDVKQWLEACDGPLFTYADDLDKRLAEAYPIAVSPGGGPIAWVKGRPSLDQVYPIDVAHRSTALLRALGPGWYDLEEDHVWSGPRAELKLPVPDECGPGQCAARLTLSPYGASDARPVRIVFKTNAADVPSPVALTLRDSARHEITVPLSADRPTHLLVIEVPGAVSPKELQGSRDTRVLGVALRSIHIVRAETR